VQQKVCTGNAVVKSGKPHPVQDQIGGWRSGPVRFWWKPEPFMGRSLEVISNGDPREMTISSLPAKRQNPAYRLG